MLRKRILIVDDEASVRQTLTTLLEHNGHVITATENADEALTRLQQDPDYDLVLTDIIMPGTDGLSLQGFREGSP